jgi:hypothetical protein
MQSSAKQPFSLADFGPFLRTLTEVEDPSVLIGGMAVSAWGEIHLEPAEHAVFDLPIYSKDVDLRGQKATSLLDPCSLFICKLHAANTRPEGEASNDIKHLAILARVIPRFLEKLIASPVAEYDAKEDVSRLLRQIEDCEAGRHPFRVPLPADEIVRLSDALRQHLR